MLLKAIVAEHDVAGPARELAEIAARQRSAVSKKTLGQVAGTLAEKFLRPALPTDDDSSNDGDTGPRDEIWFRTTSRMELPVEEHQRAVANLASLVALRNDLVHHFLENQDIFTVAGCVAADAYLESCYTQINERYMTLRSWADGLLKARESMANIMKTPEFSNFLIYGIQPGGPAASWQTATIVTLLHSAHERLAQGGWTLLNDAIKLIQVEKPEHTPKRYGCSTWRQVLHESGAFTTRKEQRKEKPTRVWYRPI